MVKHTQTIRPQHQTICLSVFDHFVALGLKGFKDSKDEIILIVSGTLLQMLRVIYDTVSNPYLVVLGFLE